MTIPIKENIEIYAEITHETRADYFVTDWKGVEKAIPKSKVILKKRHGLRGKHYVLTIPESFAVEKGFI